MDVIFNKVLKNKIIKLIKIYSIDVDELVIDFPLSIGFYHTIEYDKITNQTYVVLFHL